MICIFVVYCYRLGLSVGIVAVGTGPREEGKQLLGCLLGLCHLVFVLGVAIFIRRIMSHISVAPLVLLLFFFLVLLDVLLERLVELGNPALNAPKMEGLTTLLTVPNG